MTRSPLHRLFGALLALWLVVFTAQPAALHACPVHDGPAAGHSGGSHGGAGHSSHASAVGHAQHEQAQTPDHAGSQFCQCPGSCCTVSAVQLPSIEPSVIAAVVATRDPGLPEYAYVAVSRALLLPYANGPPRARGAALSI